MFLLIVGGGGWWVVAWSNLVSAQGPLVLGLGLKGLGLGVWGQGLTITILKSSFNKSIYSILIFANFSRLKPISTNYYQFIPPAGLY